MLMTPTGTAEYDASLSAVGEQSVKITVDAAANYVIEVLSASPISAGQLYMRALFRLPDSLEPASYVVLMEALSADAAAKISFDWRPQDFGINAGGMTQYSRQSLPKARWFCAELGIDVNARSGAVTMAIDGEVAVELTLLDTSLGSGLARYRVGLNGGPGNPALQLNVDDFIVRAGPIGCP